MEWQQPGGVQSLFQTPVIRVGQSIVNASVTVNMSPDRWIIWADGPHSAVAVLFWPYLLLVMVIGILLGRSRRTPLGVADWCLLGAGLTQIPALAAIVVVGWFFLMDVRRRNPDIGSGAFLVRQLALAGYTFVAVCCLYAALHTGLLLQPDMQITSLVGGTDALEWYQDRTDGTLPTPSVFSVSLWVWRVAMLIWALWLAVRLFSWGQWGWECFANGGWLQGGVPSSSNTSAASKTPAAAAPTTNGPSTRDGASPQSSTPPVAEAPVQHPGGAASAIAEGGTGTADEDKNPRPQPASSAEARDSTEADAPSPSDD